MQSLALHGPARRVLTVTGTIGIAYALSWIAGVSIPAPSPPLSASGAEITAALAGHGMAVAAQFTLTEGLPAAGLAVVSIALARAARRSGAAVAARAVLVAGLAAALVSLVQFLLGIALASASGRGTVHDLYGAVNQLDGIKMLLLAIMALAGAACAVLPRWLRYTGVALAVALVCSGVPYLLLWSGGAAAAYVSGPLLLLFITGSGIALGRPRDHPAPNRA